MSEHESRLQESRIQESRIKNFYFSNFGPTKGIQRSLYNLKLNALVLIIN